MEFVNNAAGVATIPPGSHAFSGPLDPGVVVHFDLKPQNSMARLNPVFWILLLKTRSHDW